MFIVFSTINYDVFGVKWTLYVGLSEYLAQTSTDNVRFTSVIRVKCQHLNSVLVRNENHY